MDLCLTFGQPDIPTLLDTPPFNDEFMLDVWLEKMRRDSMEKYSLTDHLLMKLIAVVRRLRYVGDNPKAEAEDQKIKWQTPRPELPAGYKLPEFKLMDKETWEKQNDSRSHWLTAVGTTKEEAMENAGRTEQA